jgi:IMP dehydrogenase
MRDSVEIGLGRSARRGYRLSEVGIVPSRRTRDIDQVSLTWQIDAYRFDIPLMTTPSDATMSPPLPRSGGWAGSVCSTRRGCGPGTTTPPTC